MNCETFDLHLMDALYDELDEVTTAAMKQHAESCARCASIETGMRATLEVGVLPLEQPSDDLEDRILAAAEAAQRRAPWHRKVMLGLSWAGSHAMRPQLAMAALLVLVLGSSLLLLRARPGSVAVTPVKVTERGVPMPAAADPSAVAAEPGDDRESPAATLGSAAAEAEDGEPEALASAEAQAEQDEQLAAKAGDDTAADADAEETDEQFERAMANYRAGKHGEAQKDFAAIHRRGGPKAAVAALYEARTVRWQSGCRPALSYYGTVRNQHGASPYAADAAWEQADCHKLLGEVAKANDIYEQLAGSDSNYRARAVNELASRGQAATSGKSAAAAPRKKAAPKPAAPPQDQSQQKAAPSENSAYGY
ncbi:MAG: zf-HC2 domain-containing protein [Deltaproteobacteria bacterium]|jgi:hypothetical protein|nr:zf-HC2 domain-containing protein [Deltaproteobacteria bacterium]MBW2533427.1 zf-HC2 domain-containing protein [Deltaproteobacteria bacterium]